MASPVSKESLGFLTQTARNQAVAGIAAGMALGVLRGLVSVRRDPPRDGYGIAAEGLAHVSNGVILGLLGGMAASLAGVSVAAVAGRGVLTTAAPTVASAIVSFSAQDWVDRLVRPRTDALVRSLRPRPRPPVVRRLPRPRPAPAGRPPGWHSAAS
jgi:hypothetical protein